MGGGLPSAIGSESSNEPFDLSFDIPDFSQFERRLKNVARNPKDIKAFQGLGGNIFTPLQEEREEETAALLSKIPETPELPSEATSAEEIRLSKKKVSDRAKRRTGRAASIKTGRRGLAEDEELNITRATLTG